MGTVRFEDWPLRLQAEIESARARPFKWGSHDCGTWAADIVQTLTGNTLDLPKGYRTANGSLVAMCRKTGANTMEGAVTYFLGEPLQTPLFAQRGDIVLHSSQALGVCVGSEVFCLSETGLSAIPLTECQVAWRV
ncbi:DUF6950 family protein [Ruegeria arenilitoris]|uniref:DUF6950 family protein n=1 Tax=Ruegeria arenilitoris TaxID=1173585 RepID=UPI00147CC133|nr:hypothetical protein [Ruegeria arenilitoris]